MYREISLTFLDWYSVKMAGHVCILREVNLFIKAFLQSEPVFPSSQESRDYTTSLLTPPLSQSGQATSMMSDPLSNNSMNLNYQGMNQNSYPNGTAYNSASTTSNTCKLLSYFIFQCSIDQHTALFKLKFLDSMTGGTDNRSLMASYNSENPSTASNPTVLPYSQVKKTETKKSD